ncbi:hypothetical protein F4818DRAFT_451373 [Hypoxylon cercidicola]|nr:hypothetical protein F4818DRAFT_451373 [Hypoxylon cercidicola]
MVDTVLRRPDHQAIYNTLFDRLYEGSVSRMISTREDTRKVYQDLFSEVIAKMENEGQGQQELVAIHVDPSMQIGVASPQTPSSNDSTYGSQPHASEAKRQILPSRPGSPKADTTDTTAKSGGDALPYQENHVPSGVSGNAIRNIGFEPLESGLDAWAPTFMNTAEFCNIGPRPNEMETTPRVHNIAKGLYDFLDFLNPAYLSYRAERFAKKRLQKNGGFDMIPRLKNARDIVKYWHTLGERYNDINTAFMAVRCFDLYEKQTGILTQNEPFPSSNDSELEAFTEYAERERDIKKRSVILKKDKVKWRDMMRLGRQLSLLLKDFGGEYFLILFPLQKLTTCIEEKLESIHSIQYPWDMIRSLLEHTGLGEFFRCLSGAVGQFFISDFRKDDISEGSFMKHIAPVFEKYSLKGITGTSPRLRFTASSQPEQTPLVFCGNPLRSVHLGADLSLHPLSLLQFVDQALEKDIVEHLIQQGLPGGWSLLGLDDISQAADEDMLLHDFKGIVIPLCIDDGWCLFCYVNPTRFKTAHPITFIDPTNDEERYLKALGLFTKWIPKHQDWVPEAISARSVKPIDSQVTCERDSGIHIILHAGAMARTGKPESRLMDKKMCRDFRVRHFVALLNEVQQAATKAALKNASKKV